MDGSESMKNITKIIICALSVILLVNGALGFPGYGSNTSATNITTTTNYTDIPQDTRKISIDLNNTTNSDQDIIMVQHLIEVDSVQLKAENKLFIRETLIFRNIGTEDFYGTLLTWVPDGTEKKTIRVSRSEMMTGGGLIPLDSEINGSILNWKEFVEKNSSLPFLYVVEYIAQMPSGKENLVKKFAIPGMINYRYMEKPGLAAIIVKINKSEGSTSRFLDENGNEIIPTESDQKGEMNRFSTPVFNELNLEILPGTGKSQSSNAQSGVSITVILIIGILIILALSYPYIKKKLQNQGDKTSDKTARIPKENKIKEPSKVGRDVSSGKFERKNKQELEKLKQELSSKINDITKEYESGDLLDEEYEDQRKSYQDDLDEIEKKLKKMG